MAGGVIIKDGNRNGFYDLGEGVGGVTIAVGGVKLKSWSSGAYAIEIPTEKTKVTVDVNEQAFSTYLPEGTENVKFDVKSTGTGAVDTNHIALEEHPGDSVGFGS